jgi:hypothetical protein
MQPADPVGVGTAYLISVLLAGAVPTFLGVHRRLVAEDLAEEAH